MCWCPDRRRYALPARLCRTTTGEQNMYSTTRNHRCTLLLALPSRNVYPGCRVVGRSADGQLSASEHMYAKQHHRARGIYRE